jgi:hypothetical protein
MKLINLNQYDDMCIQSALYRITLNLYEQTWEFKYRTIMNTKSNNQVQREFHSCYLSILNQMVEYETKSIR